MSSQLEVYPERVLRQARRMGVHNDCLISGNMCDNCEGIMLIIMDVLYGGGSQEEAAIGIITDLLEDAHGHRG